MRLQEMHNTLVEGGQMFKDAQGEPLTQRILLKHIQPTLRELEQITQLPLLSNTLGSVGKKASSGDIDVLVDERQISKPELINRLQQWLHSQGLNPTDYIRKSGISVHLRMPIAADPRLGHVQIDFKS